MSVCVWILVCAIFVVSANLYEPANPNLDGKDRSVNIALETVLEFNDKDNVADIQLLDNMKKLIGKVKTVIDQHNISRRGFIAGHLDDFTGFIQNLIEILNKFHDLDLKYFVTIINEELRKYHYKGCKFHELINNDGLRRFIARGLDSLERMPAPVIRTKMLSLSNKIDHKIYDENEKAFVDSINTMYKNNCNEKFEKFLVKMDDYRVNAGEYKDLVKILKDGIRSIVFDHYTKLDRSIRVSMKSKVDEYWDYLSNNSNPLRSQSKPQNIYLRNDEVGQPVNKIHHSKRHRIHNDSVKSKSLRAELKLTRETNKEPSSKSQSLEENPLHSRNDPQIYEGLSDEATTESIKLTFKTLYPKFGSDWTSSSRPGNKQFAQTTPKHEHSVSNQEEIIMGEDPEIRVINLDQIESQEIKHTTRTKQKITELMSNTHAHTKSSKGKIKLSKRPILTFMTLYPELITKQRNSHKVNQQRAIKSTHSTPKSSLQTLLYEPNQNSEMNEMHDAGEPRALNVEAISDKPGKRMTNHLKHGVYSKRHQNRETKPRLSTKYKQEVPETPNTHDGPFGNYLLVSENNEESPTNTTHSYRRSFRGNNMIPNKHFSGDSLRDTKPRDSYRREEGNKNIPEDADGDRDTILTRIKQLENDLISVKTQLKNDTEIINDLNTKLLEEDTICLNDDIKRTNSREIYSHQSETTKYKPQIKNRKDVYFNSAEKINVNDGRKRKDGKYEAIKKHTTNWKGVDDRLNFDSNNNRKVVDKKYNYDSNTFKKDHSEYYGGPEFLKYNERNRVTTKINRYELDYGELKRKQEREYYFNLQKYTKDPDKFMNTKEMVYAANKGKYSTQKYYHRNVLRRDEQRQHTSTDDNYKKDLARKYFDSWKIKKYRNQTNFQEKDFDGDTHKKAIERKSFMGFQKQYTYTNKRYNNERYAPNAFKQYNRNKDEKKYVRNPNGNTMPRISTTKSYTKDNSKIYYTRKVSYTKEIYGGYDANREMYNRMRHNFDWNKDGRSTMNDGRYSKSTTQMKAKNIDKEYNDRKYVPDRAMYKKLIEINNSSNINELKSKIKEHHYAYGDENMTFKNKIVIQKLDEGKIDKGLKENNGSSKDNFTRYNKEKREDIDHYLAEKAHKNKLKSNENFKVEGRNANNNGDDSKNDTDKKYAHNASNNESNYFFKSDANKDLDPKKDGETRKRVDGTLEKGVTNNIVLNKEQSQSSLHTTNLEKDFVSDSLRKFNVTNTQTTALKQSTKSQLLSTIKVLNHIVHTEKSPKIKNVNNEHKIEKKTTTFKTKKTNSKKSRTSNVKTTIKTTLEEIITIPFIRPRNWRPPVSTGARRVFIDNTPSITKFTETISTTVAASKSDVNEDDNTTHPANDDIPGQLDINKEDNSKEVTSLDPAEKDNLKDTQLGNEEKNDTKLQAEDKMSETHE